MRVASLLHDYLMGTGATRWAPADVANIRKSAPLRARTRLFGIPLHDGDLGATFTLVEKLLAQPGARSELSFLDGRSFVRQLVDKQYRRRLSHQMLLLSGGTIMRFLGQRVFARGTAHVRRETFVPSLLTFVERPLKVLVMGPDERSAQMLRDHLQAHAPWHQLVAERLPQASAVDLVIVAGQAVGIRDHVQLADVRYNLAVFSGERLAASVALADQRVAATASRRISDEGRPSKAA